MKTKAFAAVILIMISLLIILMVDSHCSENYPKDNCPLPEQNADLENQREDEGFSTKSDLEEIEEIPVQSLATPCELLIDLLTASDYSMEEIPGNQLIVVKSFGSDAEIFLFEKSVEDLWVSHGETIRGWVGKNGVTLDKKEGDKKTPVGLFALETAFGIKDKPNTKMDYRAVTENSFWVDDPSSDCYNTWQEGSEQKDWNSAEHLIDYTPQYNYGVVIDYNTSPTVPGLGSAIFLHCGTDTTSGCVAVSERDMLYLLEWLDPLSIPSILIL